MNSMYSAGLIFCLLLAGTALAQSPDFSAFERREYRSPEGDTLQYRILYPKNYQPRRRYPLVLFLHGAGERGQDNERQLTHGAAQFLDSANRAQYPAIVVFPQCPQDRYWLDLSMRRRLHAGQEVTFEETARPPVREMALVIEWLDQVLRDESVDKNRCYLMGLSMGGFGTFDLLARRPTTFAAAVAICGGGNTELAVRYAPHTALWLTHGAQDDVVPVKYSRQLYAALQELGADVRYTEFPEANHNAWDPTFALPDLLPWLFGQKKK